MPETFEDLPVLAVLGERVHAAAEAAAATGAAGRVRQRSTWTPRLLAVVIAFAVPVAAGSAGATLYVLRGSIIPAPTSTPPEQLPAPGTAELSQAVAGDPRAGEPEWTVRLATSRTGLACSTVGQLVGGRFGIVGLDGRFRSLAPDVADACSTPQRDAATLVGARTFDAPRRRDIRTLVSGVGGARLRAVSVQAGGRTRTVAVRRGGVFVLPLVGLPEDLGLRLALRFADGHVERHAFGVGPLVFRDPEGGAAWKVSEGGFGAPRGQPVDPTVCITVTPAREVSNPVSSPAACGRLGGTQRHPTGLFFDVRRLAPGVAPPAATAGPFGPGRWKRHAPRLLVWGAAGRDARAVRLVGRGAGRATGTWFAPNGAFAFMLGPDARPGDVQLEVRFRDGRVVRAARPTGLTPPPTSRRSP